jgi:uncharacterized protein (TIGR02265 family)
MRGPILPTETIPVHLLNQLTVSAARLKGETIDHFARRAGHDAAGDAINGIYRFFVMVMTPTSLLSKASQMWRAVYNRGDLRISDQTDHSAVVQLLDFPSEVAGCARITGWIERLAELTGAREVRIKQTQCFAKGEPHCEWSISWN